MMKSRQAQLIKVDQRVRLIQEVLNGIRVVKLYAYESFFRGRIAKLRAEGVPPLFICVSGQV
jgi:ATP-binding cassette subfamily C (CFTR/MRP) protein 1